eukprot:14865340-Heterocapsa_arctica.AAC.1
MRSRRRSCRVKHNYTYIENQEEREKRNEAYDNDNNKEQHRMRSIRGNQRSSREKKRISREGGTADEEEQQRGRG